MNKVKLNFPQGTGTQVSVAGETNLLEEVDATGVMIARGCMAGSCGVCRMEVISGIENFLPADVVEQDTIDSFDTSKKWRLACCAQVCGDIEVLVDQQI